MEPPQEQEADSLATLEERIRQAIDLVTRLRREAAEAREEAAKLPGNWRRYGRSASRFEPASRSCSARSML